MLIFLWILLIIFGSIYKKSNIVTLMQIMFMMFLFSTCIDNADYENYAVLFGSICESWKYIFNGNVLFNLLLLLFSCTGNYNIALTGIAVLGFTILYKGITFYTDKISFVLSLYMLSPFVIDSVQIKNFIAMVIFIYFSRYIYMAFLENQKIKNTLLYLIGVTIVIGFHYSFVTMYLFAILPWIKVKKSLLFSIIMIIVSFNRKMLNLLNILVAWLGKMNFRILENIVSKIYDYSLNFNYEKTYVRFKLTLIFYIVNLIIIVLVYELLYKGRINKDKRKIMFIFSMNLLVSFIFPLMVYSMELYRFQRNILVINYAILSCDLPNKNLKFGSLSIQRILCFISLITMSIFYLYFDCIRWNYESVFRPLFKLV